MCVMVIGVLSSQASDFEKLITDVRSILLRRDGRERQNAIDHVKNAETHFSSSIRYWVFRSNLEYDFLGSDSSTESLERAVDLVRNASSEDLEDIRWSANLFFSVGQIRVSGFLLLGADEIEPLPYQLEHLLLFCMLYDNQNEAIRKRMNLRSERGLGLSSLMKLVDEQGKEISDRGWEIYLGSDRLDSDTVSKLNSLAEKFPDQERLEFLQCVALAVFLDVRGDNITTDTVIETMDAYLSGDVQRLSQFVEEWCSTFDKWMDIYTQSVSQEEALSWSITELENEVRVQILYGYGEEAERLKGIVERVNESALFEE